MLYRTLQPGESRPANVLRLRVPTKDCTNGQRPKAGYRCPNAACSVAVMLLEVDSTTLPHPHAAPNVRCAVPVLREAYAAGELLRRGGVVAVEGR
jgi:hypothetical protein